MSALSFVAREHQLKEAQEVVIVAFAQVALKMTVQGE